MMRTNDFMTEADITIIFEKVLTYLSECGVKVQHTGVLKKLSVAGAKVDFQNENVRFPQELVKEYMTLAPRSFTLAADDRGLDMLLPSADDGFYACTNTGARGIIDPYTGTYRAVTLTDVQKWGSMVEQLENIHMCAVPTPTDVPADTADVHGLRTLLTATRKHIWVQPHNIRTLSFLFDLALVISEGEGRLKKWPRVSFIADALTPFQFKEIDMEIILQAARFGIPIHASCVPVMGGTSPITTLGTVILAGIEVLALLLIAQIVCAGTPVLGLSSSLMMDMRSGRALKASLDAIRTNAACARFIHEAYGIPTHICGMTTDAVVPDGQAQVERCLGGLILAQSGVDIMGRAGELEAAKIISPAQLIIDNELVAMIRHLLQPLSRDEEMMVWEDLFAVGSGGNFLEQSSTLNLYSRAFRSPLFGYKPDDISESAENLDLIERARQKALKIWQASPETKSQPRETLVELDRIVNEADHALGVESFVN